MSKEVTIMGKTRVAGTETEDSGNLQPISVDNFGRVLTYPYFIRNLISTGSASLTGGTKTSLIATPGAGLYNDLIMLYGQNTSTVAITVTILDESTTVDTFSVAASSRFNRDYTVPIPQSGANTAWYVDLGDDNNSTVTVNALAVKNK